MFKSDGFDNSRHHGAGKRAPANQVFQEEHQNNTSRFSGPDGQYGGVNKTNVTNPFNRTRDEPEQVYQQVHAGTNDQNNSYTYTLQPMMMQGGM